MTKSTAERQRAYKARKAAQGLVRVAEWVHKDDADLMREFQRHFAAMLRQRREHAKMPKQLPR